MNIELKENTLTPEEFIRLRVDAGFMEVPYAQAEKALEKLGNAFDMPYMGKDRCDDATRNYLRENIKKAKEGDPSGFIECLKANYGEETA